MHLIVFRRLMVCSFASIDIILPTYLQAQSISDIKMRYSLTAIKEATLEKVGSLEVDFYRQNFDVVLGLGQAQAQRATVIRSLQPEVRIAEKAATRLVLYHSALKVPLVMTIAQELDSHIFGDSEAKRGGNPYRVWMTTEKFWNTTALAEDGGGKFFHESFVKTLRRIRRKDESNISPQEEFTAKEV